MTEQERKALLDYIGEPLTLQERVKILDSAIDTLYQADMLISSRINEDGATECVVFEPDVVLAMFYGVLGAKKLLAGEPAGKTEVQFINLMTGALAAHLEATSDLIYEPYEQVKERLEAVGLSISIKQQPGDDAS